jgi:hypothetical protein
MSRLLTLKQEAFCQKFIELKDASKAYRACYNVKPTTKPTTIWRTAKSILDNPKVAARIEELRKPAADAVILTLAEHLAELASIRDMAKAEKQFSAASSAEQSRGKAAGLYVEKKHITGSIGIEAFLAEVGDDA